MQTCSYEFFTLLSRRKLLLCAIPKDLSCFHQIVHNKFHQDSISIIHPIVFISMFRLQGIGYNKMAETDQDLLQTLPELVMDQLLGYFNYHDWLKLRLVSSEWKNLAESSTESYNILKRLEKFPDSQQFFQEACSLNLKLSRLNISRTYNYEFRPLCLLTNLGASLKFLRLDNFNGGTVSASQLEFLSHCTSLETLCIGTLDLTYPTINLSDDEEFSKLGPILEGLKHFSIDKICFRNPPSLEMEYFEKLIKLSKNVETLKVPLIVEKSRLELDSDNYIPFKYNFIAKPILKYVAKRGCINNLHSLDMTNFDADFYTTFIKLVRVCDKTGTFLENVNYSLISKLITNKYDPQLLNVIKSITKWNGNGVAFEHLKNVNQIMLDLDLDLFNPSPVDPLSKIYPKTEDIELTIWTSNGINFENKGTIKEAVEIFLKNGKSLKQVTVVERYGHHNLPTPIHLLANFKHFKNLTVLKCKSFQRFSDNDFISILKNLRKLQELEIDTLSSNGLTDSGICSVLSIDGKYENMGRCLKDLRKLKITNHGFKFHEAHNDNITGQPLNASPWSKLKNRLTLKESSHAITDYSFSKIFRHLKLKSFLVQSPDSYITKLGYAYLLKGEFADTIEFFPEPNYLPTGLNAEEFYKFRSNFKHLKDNGSGCGLDNTIQIMRVSLSQALGYVC